MLTVTESVETNRANNDNPPSHHFQLMLPKLFYRNLQNRLYEPTYDKNCENKAK